MRFYTGSYNQKGSPAPKPKGDGIGIFNLDVDKGEVIFCGYQNQRNPSYICISANNKYLFAAEELPEGNGASVFSYLISNEGKLELIDSKEIAGAYACHIAICKAHLIIANYMSGDASVFKILQNGHLSSCTQMIKHAGSGPDKSRQESPHVHMAFPWNTDRVFLVDLGLDMAQSYYFDDDHQKFVKEEKLSLKVDPGAGARHMVRSDDNALAFVLGELTSEIFVFENVEGTFVKTHKTSIIKDGTKCIPSGAAIKVHPNGNFIYATDRTTNSIAIFRVNKSEKNLSIIGFQESGGNAPRDFGIDPTGRWLIVANQDSNNLVVFSVNKENGLLTKHSSVKVNTPVNVCFQHLN